MGILLALAATVCVVGAVAAMVEGRGRLSMDQWVVFVVVPIAAATTLVMVLRRSAQVRAKVALLILATGFGLIAAEMMAIAVVHAAGRGDARPAWDDTRPMFRELMRLRRQGDRAYPTVPGNILVERDLVVATESGPVHPVTPTVGGRTAILCAEGGEPVTYHADRFGFNNPDSVWDLESIDVALVGDSYTQGVCVPELQQMATLLRRDRGLLNLGVRGAGPLQELAVLREYGAPFTPDRVVWIYFEGNDIWELARETERAWLTDYLEPGHTQVLREHQSSVDESLASWLDSLVAREEFAAPPPPIGFPDRLASLPRFATLRDLTGFGVLFPDSEPALGILPRLLDRARSDVEGWGGRLVLVYMPAYERYSTLLGEGLPGRRELRRYSVSRGIPLVDLDSAFSVFDDPRELWAVPGGHLNALGYRIAGDAVEGALRSSR